MTELLGRQPLLRGKNPISQLKLIIKLLGPQRGEVRRNWRNNYHLYDQLFITD